MTSIEAIILCGGWGTRMGDTMRSYPCKSLVPVLGRPCLAYVLEALKAIDCSRVILCIDRDQLYDDINQVGVDAKISFTILGDSGGGPTSVAVEAAPHVRTSHFLMLHGHQIVYPDFLMELAAESHDFVATTYKDSTEGVRKIAALDDAGFCVRVRRGSSVEPALDEEVYLDKPYKFKKEHIANTVLSDQFGDPASPVDADLRPNTIFRYLRVIYTKSASFRHEFHYSHELSDVTCGAETFRKEYSAHR